MRIFFFLAASILGEKAWSKPDSSGSINSLPENVIRRIESYLDTNATMSLRATNSFYYNLLDAMDAKDVVKKFKEAVRSQDSKRIREIVQSKEARSDIYETKNAKLISVIFLTSLDLEPALKSTIMVEISNTNNLWPLTDQLLGSKSITAKLEGNELYKSIISKANVHNVMTKAAWYDCANIFAMFQTSRAYHVKKSASLFQKIITKVISRDSIKIFKLLDSQSHINPYSQIEIPLGKTIEYGDTYLSRAVAIDAPRIFEFLLNKLEKTSLGIVLRMEASKAAELSSPNVATLLVRNFMYSPSITDVLTAYKNDNFKVGEIYLTRRPTLFKDVLHALALGKRYNAMQNVFTKFQRYMTAEHYNILWLVNSYEFIESIMQAEHAYMYIDDLILAAQKARKYELASNIMLIKQARTAKKAIRALVRNDNHYVVRDYVSRGLVSIDDVLKLALEYSSLHILDMLINVYNFKLNEQSFKKVLSNFVKNSRLHVGKLGDFFDILTKKNPVIQEFRENYGFSLVKYADEELQLDDVSLGSFIEELMKRNYTVDATEKEFYGITEKKQRLIFGSFGYQDTSSDSSSEIVFHREQETDLAGESSNQEAKRDN